MFLDEVAIIARGGDGGRGVVSWRREKYVPKGGPDGGNGGKGGDVRLIADANTDTLSAFSSRKRFQAENGKMGMGKKCHGRDGESLILKVPPGTLVYEQLATPSTGNVVLADLERPGDEMIVAHGGRGGCGNAHFVNSYRQRPDFAELGEPGEERHCRLELKLIADVGIIGLPNVGKSTLITAISSAHPRVADYPFTTLIPNLGVVMMTDTSYVVCDVPGLIEGASAGRGLGDRFLRHIERCGLLLHLLDVTRGDALAQDYQTIRKELAAYSPTLSKKKEIIILNKIDLLPEKIRNPKLEIRNKKRDTSSNIKTTLRKSGIEVFASISAATKNGTEELKKKLLPLVLAERQNRQRVTGDEPACPVGRPTSNTAIPILRPHLASPRASSYQIQQEGATVRICGKRIEQIAAMTDVRNAGAVRRLLSILDRIGVIAALRSRKLSTQQQIFIGKTRIDHLL